jgi:hypothetical protein
MSEETIFLSKDLFLAPFFEQSFNSQAYSSSIIRGSSIGGNGDGETTTEQALRQLRSRGATVDAAVRRLVATHQEALVDQAQQTRNAHQSQEGLT